MCAMGVAFTLLLCCRMSAARQGQICASSKEDVITGTLDRGKR